MFSRILLCLCLVAPVSFAQGENKMMFGFYSFAPVASNESCEALFKKAHDSGINFYGPFYGNYAVNTPLPCQEAANKYDIKLVFALNAASVKDNVSVIKEKVKAKVKGLLSDPAKRAVIGAWEVGEELRFWVKSEMTYLSTEIAAIREAEDELGFSHLPTAMYEPNNRDYASLVLTGRRGIDIQMRGIYYSKSELDSGWPASIKTVVSQHMVPAMKKLGNIEVPVLSIFGDYSTKGANARVLLSNDTSAMMAARQVAYIALISGAKGIWGWSWFPHGLTISQRNVIGNGMMSVAKDMNGRAALAPVLLNGKKLDVPVPLVNGIANATAVVYGFYQYNNQSYLLMVNTNASSPVDVSFSLPVKTDAVVQPHHDIPVVAFTSSQTSENIQLSTTLSPRQVAVFDVIPEQRTFINTSFTINAACSGGFDGSAGAYFYNCPSGKTFGWYSTSPLARIDVFQNFYDGISIPKGAIELNGDEANYIYQNIYLHKGEVLKWSFDHAARMSLNPSCGTPLQDMSPNPEEATLEIQNFNSENTGNGKTRIVLANVRSNQKGVWKTYTGTTQINLDEGVYRVGFKAIRPGTTGRCGNLIANPSIQLSH